MAIEKRLLADVKKPGAKDVPINNIRISTESSNTKSDATLNKIKVTAEAAATAMTNAGIIANLVRFKTVKDGFFDNPVLKFGQSDSFTNASTYDTNLITLNRQLILSTYNSSWVFRRVIDKVAQDMWSHGVQIESSYAPEQLKGVYRKLNRLSSELIFGTQQARLFGGAVSLIMVDDENNDLSTPLNLKGIKKGAAIRLKTYDRWYGVEVSSEKVTDYRSSEFGKPMFYTFYNVEGQNMNGLSTFVNSQKVHHSRVLRYTNRRAPLIIEQMTYGWGTSELEHIFQDLLAHDNTKAAAASLLSKALLEIIKIEGMKGMMTGLSVGNSRSQNDLAVQLSAINNFRATNNLVLLDSKDTYESHAFSYNGLSELLQTQKEIVAGAAEMPQVLIYGDTKGGLTSDSPAELKFYAGTINGKQETDCRPILDKLLPILCRTQGLEYSSELDYEFENIAEDSKSSKIELINTTITSVNTLVENGLITHETGLQEVQQLQKSAGFGNNITERDFALAKKQDAYVKDNPNEDENNKNNPDSIIDTDDYKLAENEVLQNSEVKKLRKLFDRKNK